jgi:hypothetical protein
MGEKTLPGWTAGHNAQIQVIQAPDFRPVSTPSVFLAGGITGSPDWQAEAINLFGTNDGIEVSIINPRRKHSFTLSDDAVACQVRWENFYLDQASVVLFWFTGGRALQPIALYELGKIGAGSKPIVVGADLDYRRRLDVVLQLSHARPGLEVSPSLAQTVARARQVLSAGDQRC